VLKFVVLSYHHFLLPGCVLSTFDSSREEKKLTYLAKQASGSVRRNVVGGFFRTSDNRVEEVVDLFGTGLGAVPFGAYAGRQRESSSEKQGNSMRNEQEQKVLSSAFRRNSLSC